MFGEVSGPTPVAGRGEPADPRHPGDQVGGHSRPCTAETDPRLRKVVTMTEIESAEEAPSRSLPASESATATERPSSTARLVGVDLARAVAVASGRASALFATLAGFSLVLIAGRLEPKTGPAGRRRPGS